MPSIQDTHKKGAKIELLHFSPSWVGGGGEEETQQGPVRASIQG